MSLQTRLTALAQAIGADIKSFDTRLDTLEAAGGGGGIPDRFVTSRQTTTNLSGVAITELSGVVLAPGRYAIKAWLVWQSSGTAIGAGFWPVTVGGTVTRNVGHIYTQTTGGAAATGVADQQSSGATAQMVESRAWRGGVDPGPFTGVDTANADQMSVMEAILVVTAQTTLNIMMKPEVAGTVSIEEGSLLEFKAIG